MLGLLSPFPLSSATEARGFLLSGTAPGVAAAERGGAFRFPSAPRDGCPESGRSLRESWSPGSGGTIFGTIFLFLVHPRIHWVKSLFWGSSGGPAVRFFGLV